MQARRHVAGETAVANLTGGDNQTKPRAGMRGPERGQKETSSGCMANISTSALGIKPLAKRNYFDAIKVRTRRDLTLVERRFLRKHAHFAGVHRGRYIPGFSLGVLTVVAPEVAALQFIAELPGAIINRLEIAVDVIVDAETKWMLRGVFDEHFVQPWHRTKVQCRLEGGPTAVKQMRR
jgi:hypothetical protein